MNPQKANKDFYLDILEKILEPYINNQEMDEIYNSVYDDAASRLEYFSRILLGLGPYLYNRYDENVFKKILDEISCGVNPQDEKYWGKKRCMDQVHVEMFSILFFLYKNYDNLTNDFIKKNKENIINWFSNINEVNLPKNNWLFFKLLVNTLLCKLDFIEINWKDIRELQRQIDEMYISDGFYCDGEEGRVDYYNSFAFHFYSLIYVSLMEEDVNTCLKYIERARMFANNFKLFFSCEGESIAYGRSLLYRFGVLAFWSVAIYVDKDIVDKNFAKTLIYKNINYWMRQEIFDINGNLNMGYCYRNHLLMEDYSSYGSPYWALKAFIFLYIDDNDIFWNCDNSSELIRTDGSFLGQFINVYKKDGISYLFPSKTVEDDIQLAHYQDKYLKFCYSSLFGFNISKGAIFKKELALDSTYCVSFDNVKYIPRYAVQNMVIEDGIIRSLWETKDCKIVSYVVHGAPWHTRIHIIQTEEPLYFVEGGYPINSDNKFNTCIGSEEIIVKNDDVVSAIYSLENSSVFTIEKLYPNSNIKYRKTVIPVLNYYLKKGKHMIINSFYGATKEYSERPIIRISQDNVFIKQNNNEYNIKISCKIAKNRELKTIKKLKELYRFTRDLGR